MPFGGSMTHDVRISPFAAEHLADFKPVLVIAATRLFIRQQLLQSLIRRPDTPASSAAHFLVGILLQEFLFLLGVTVSLWPSVDGLIWCWDWLVQDPLNSNSPPSWACIIQPEPFYRGAICRIQNDVTCFMAGSSSRFLVIFAQRSGFFWQRTPPLLGRKRDIDSSRSVFRVQTDERLT